MIATVLYIDYHPKWGESRTFHSFETDESYDDIAHRLSQMALRLQIPGTISIATVDYLGRKVDTVAFIGRGTKNELELWQLIVTAAIGEPTTRYTR